ncbi:MULTISPECIES: DUF805 domain-containing protein [unclassified Modestobacter]|uniref:DUF805 domain-containing protein n=1 Tax=unclassified Modestobacter TaxID=2643866 RepID=UPI0022AA639F|nr:MULTISPECIES: DUF805 domain-containing protein [unclassified Modestobacter]MCZ2823734.1 DUF805 domain-containing protein [Modestobacter sp. VKM Ac-2981]MCZ2851979.1 DUF805 domain-containing protein [Modestobacter sp. VKM Ac-2982]
MDFWQWYVRRGRIDRRTWWLQYALPIGALSVLALMADVALGNSSLESIAMGETGYGPIVTTIGLLAMPASISSGATRLHDRGMSAWWLLIGLVPLFGQLALLVITGFLPGDGGPNRYGPPPSAAPLAAPQPEPAPEPERPPYWG